MKKVLAIGLAIVFLFTGCKKKAIDEDIEEGLIENPYPDAIDFNIESLSFNNEVNLDAPYMFDFNTDFSDFLNYKDTGIFIAGKFFIYNNDTVSTRIFNAFIDYKNDLEYYMIKDENNPNGIYNLYYKLEDTAYSISSNDELAYISIFEGTSKDLFGIENPVKVLTNSLNSDSFDTEFVSKSGEDFDSFYKCIYDDCIVYEFNGYLDTIVDNSNSDKIVVASILTFSVGLNENMFDVLDYYYSIRALPPVETAL